MKQIIFILCVFIVFLTSANAEEYYNCVDKDGNTILTTTPQDGMKCEIKADDSELRQKERAQQKAEEGMIKCTTHISRGGFMWQTCRDRNGKGKVVSFQQI